MSREPKVVYEKSWPVGFNCSCGYYFDILDSSCWNCFNPRPKQFQELALRVYWRRQGSRYIEYADNPPYASSGERIIDLPIDEKDIELHSKFYNNEMGLAAEMPLEALAVHIEELEKICFEGKVRLQASRQNQKERVAKLSKAERDKLVSKGEFRIDESDSLIRKRTEKLTGADKMLANFKGLGLSDEAIKDLMKNVKIDEKGKKTASGYSETPKPPAPKANTVVFNGKAANTQASLRDDAAANGLKALADGIKAGDDKLIESAASSFSTAAHIAKKVDASLKDEQASKVEEIKKEIQEETKPEKAFWEIF